MERGLDRRFSSFDISRYVLEHDDCIVDDETDCDRQGHQRKVVETVTERPHQGARAEEREWHGHAGNDGCPETPQEDEDNHHDEEDRDEKRKLNVGDGSPDRLGSVAQREHVDGRRHCCAQLWQRCVDFVHRLDDVGTRLLEDHKNNSTLAVGPPCLRGILRTGHSLPDIPNAKRCPIPIGHDNVVPVL